MKRAFITFSLLLLAGLIPTGADVALAESPDQTVQTTGCQTTPDMPPFDGAEPEFECQGDPDDAITGNRYNGSPELEDDMPEGGDLPVMSNLDMMVGDGCFGLSLAVWGLGSM